MSYPKIIIQIFLLVVMIMASLSANAQNEDKGLLCIITYTMADTNEFSGPSFKYTRKHLNDSVFVEEHYPFIDTFKIVNGEWLQTFLGKDNIVFSKNHFLKNEPTKFYTHPWLSNDHQYLPFDTVVYKRDTIVVDYSEYHCSIFEPLYSTTLNGEICYVYIEYDCQKRWLGKIYFNFNDGIIRSEGGDFNTVMIMTNVERSEGCR